MRRITASLFVFLGACSSNTVAPSPDAALTRADAEFLAGNFASAAHLYEQTLPLVDHARRAAVLGTIGKCRLGAGDADGAIDAFGQALASNPSDVQRVDLLYRRAMAHNARWSPAEALADMARVREAPDAVRDAAVRSEEFLYRFGITVLRAGDWKGGRALLAELAAKHPNSREAMDARDRMAMTDFRVQVARAREPKPASGCEAVPSASGDYLVLMGRFARLIDAVREMERLRRDGHPGAFVVP